MTHEERLREITRRAVLQGTPEASACDAGATALAITRKIAEGDPWRTEVEGPSSREAGAVSHRCRYCNFEKGADYFGQAHTLEKNPHCLYLRCVELHAAASAAPVPGPDI